MILLCYDGSDSSKGAMSLAHKMLRDDHVTMLHVWSPPDKVLADSFSTRDTDGESSPSQATLEMKATQRAREVVDEGDELANDLGLKVEILEARNRSSVSQTILDVAERLDAELIVVGTHGTTAVQDQPLGSVSDGLVHHAKRPVLVVPTAK